MNSFKDVVHSEPKVWLDHNFSTSRYKKNLEEFNHSKKDVKELLISWWKIMTYPYIILNEFINLSEYIWFFQFFFNVEKWT